MVQKTRLLLVLIPNLVLLASQGVSPARRVHFDESYQSEGHQVWIKYDSQNPRRFRGVFVSREEEKNIWGLREGGFFFWWSEDLAWTAELLSPKKDCEPTLKISEREGSGEPLFLKADYCESMHSRK